MRLNDFEIQMAAAVYIRDYPRTDLFILPAYARASQLRLRKPLDLISHVDLCCLSDFVRDRLSLRHRRRLQNLLLGHWQLF